MRFSMFRWAFGLSLLFFSLSGCMKENPVRPDEGTSHAEAVGLVILQGEEVLVRYAEGIVTGALTVRVGEETPVLSVRFIDQKTGGLFVPDPDHHPVVYRIADEGVVEVRESGEAMFVLRGRRAGQTTLEIRILHGEHADFVSAPIPVGVTE